MQSSAGENMTLTNPIGRFFSSSRASAKSGSKYWSDSSVCGLRLVRQGPDDHARPVLVPVEELPDRLRVRPLGDLGDGLGGEHLVDARAEHRRDRAVHPHGRRLVDDDDAVRVGVVQDLLGVRVVGGAEGVGADPAQQREVVDHRDVVVALPAGHVVLVHAEAPEVEGPAVDEEVGAAHLHRAHAGLLGVGIEHGAVVVQHLDDEVVEVAVARLPQVHLGHAQLAGGSGALSHLVPDGVEQAHAHRCVRRRAAEAHLVGDRARHPLRRRVAVDAGNQRHVADVRRRRGVEPHLAVQARIVEEVVHVLLPWDRARCPQRCRAGWSPRSGGCPPPP